MIIDGPSTGATPVPDRDLDINETESGWSSGDSIKIGGLNNRLDLPYMPNWHPPVAVMRSIIDHRDPGRIPLCVWALQEKIEIHPSMMMS